MNRIDYSPYSTTALLLRALRPCQVVVVLLGCIRLVACLDMAKVERFFDVNHLIERGLRANSETCEKGIMQATDEGLHKRRGGGGGVAKNRCGSIYACASPRPICEKSVHVSSWKGAFEPCPRSGYSLFTLPVMLLADP